jgi:hypothetical protein
MMRLADGGRILLFNSNIFGPVKGYLPHHPGMIGKKGDQCEIKKSCYDE